MDWEQQQQPQQQPQPQPPFQPSHKPAGLNTQQQQGPGSNPTGAGAGAGPNAGPVGAGGTSVLQPFQVAFGQPKQHLPAGYYQVFQQQGAGGRTLPNLSYSMQTNSQQQQQQLQSSQTQDQQHAQRQQQQQQQLILQQQQQMQHQYQQQQLINQQPVTQQTHQPQTQQTQHIVHQSQHTEKQTQQQQQQHIQHSELMRELQPHLEHTSHIQQQQQHHQPQQQQQSMQHIHSHQALQSQTLQQSSQQTHQPQSQPQPQQPPLPQQKSNSQIQQRSQHILEYHLSGGQTHNLLPSHPDQQPTQLMSHSLSHLLSDKPAQDIQYPRNPQPSPPISVTPGDDEDDDDDDESPQAPHRSQLPVPREGEGTLGKDNPFLMPVVVEAQGGPQGAQDLQKGAPSSEGPLRGVLLVGEGVGELKAAPTGVIQSTRRKRRVSQEVNLETLAQKASEMECLPPQIVKVRDPFFLLCLCLIIHHLLN